MSQVHVQSVRNPDLAFCGAALQGVGILPVHLGHLDAGALKKALRSGFSLAAYVTPDQARRMIHSPVGDGGVPGGRGGVAFHAACMLNLGRFLGRLGLDGDRGGDDD
jgi:hypothetical protein